MRKPTLLRQLLSPIYLLPIVFGCFVIFLHLHYHAAFKFNAWSMMFASLAAVIVFLINLSLYLRSLFSDQPKNFRGLFSDTAEMLAEWLPFIILIFFYENLHHVTYILRPDTLDRVLMKIDEAIFGFQPAFWIEKISNPYLVDYMALFYALWLFFPLTLQMILWFKKMRTEFHAIMIAQLLCFYIGFVGYITVPAIGPKYVLINQFQKPEVEGVYLQHPTRYLIDKLEAVNRDCFPSLHTAITGIGLFFAFRVRKKIPRGRLILGIFLISTLSVWASTIFLREHWVVDVLAGIILSYFSYKISPRIIEFWENRNRLTSSA
ncbi:MAG: phosphatase PAP2 family protein [bacterium]|nr:phosphatase PAP2 family protein [bacterium]